jgi:SOS response regulatory protein OraA/RecX
MERDVLKLWKKQKLRLALLGFENQTDPDLDMPLRVMGYDGIEYRAQLNERKAGERFPVVTLILYFGYEKRWGRATSLLERLSIPEKFRPFVSDYKINVFEIAYLTREQVNLFKSDFRVVADYLVQKRENGDYIPNTQELKHIQETLQLLGVMTGDHRFEEAYNDNHTERRPHNMCDVLDRIENRGIQTGIQKGEAQVMRNIYQKGFSLEQIADVVEKTVDEVKDIIMKEKPLLF